MKIALWLFLGSASMAVLLYFVVMDWIVGWITSRIILRPWQRDTQEKAIQVLYGIAWATCNMVWGIWMLYLASLMGIVVFIFL